MEQNSGCALAGHHEGPQRVVAILVSPAAGGSSGASVNFTLGVLPRRWACQATLQASSAPMLHLSLYQTLPQCLCQLIWTLVRLHR